MKCSKAQKLISEYVDGELDKAAAAALEEHLESCAECREVLEDFQDILAEARTMETEEPPDSAWVKIRRTLNTLPLKPAEEKKPVWGGITGVLAAPRFRFAMASAAAVLLVAVGLFVFKPWSGPVVPTDENREAYTLAKLAEAQEHYQLAIKALSEAAQAQQGEVDPMLAEAFRRNLEVVDDTIETCRNLVREDPSNVDNQNYLLASYKDKVGILTDFISLERQMSGPETGAKTAI